MATLGEKSVGDIVKLKESGTLVDYLIVHQGLPSSLYDDSCDGTWLLRKDILENRQWNSSNVNDYANSTINAWLNSEYLAMLDADIQAAVKEVKIPYRPGSGTSVTINSGANGLSCKIFLLSATEVGYTKANVNSYIPDGEGAKLDYFTNANVGNDKIAYLNGSATFWWLRSPYTSSATYVWYVFSNGDASGNGCSSTYGVRPALILPSSINVSDKGEVSASTGPKLPYIIKLGANGQSVPSGTTPHIMRLGPASGEISAGTEQNKIYIIKL